MRPTAALLAATLCLCAAPLASAAPAPRKRPAAPRPAPAPAPAPSRPADPLPAPPPRAAAAPAEGLGTAVVLGAGAHIDDGTQRGHERRSIQVTRDDADFTNAGLLFAHAALLTPYRPRLRVGVAARYFGTYDYKVKGADEEVSLGYLGEAVALAEYALPMQDRMHLLLGAEAGLAVVVPSGDFERQIRAYQDQGAGVWNVPRLGYVVGPSVGGRYRVGDRLAVRVDFGALWSQTLLYFTKGDVGGVGFERRLHHNVIRYRLEVSIEVPL